MSEEMEEFKEKLRILKKPLKNVIPIIITSLFVGGILKYVLATRGFENMVLVAAVIIVLSIRRIGK